MVFKADPKVAVKHTQIFINNQFVDSESKKTFTVINPSTGNKICDVQEGDKADVEKAVAAAKKAFEIGSVWRAMDAWDRHRLLNKLADLVERDTEYLANLNSLENGKPFVDSVDDIRFTTMTFHYYAGRPAKINGKPWPADVLHFSYTGLKPVGVCGLIIPWNFPILTISDKIAPAIAAGNVLVLKPAEQTPLTALYFASLVKEAGFPPGVVNIVPGYGPTAGGAITEHLGVDEVSFIGSKNVEIDNLADFPRTANDVVKFLIVTHVKLHAFICSFLGNTRH